MTIISKVEWARRYAAHISKASGMSNEHAEGAAAAALENGDAEMHATPEDAADEEMSCWTDDEGAID